MKMFKKAAVTIILMCMILGGTGWEHRVLAKQEIQKTPDSDNVFLSDPKYGGTSKGQWKGDRIYLGSYEQDGNTGNGKEAVCWRVLKVLGNKVLLLSEYALDVKPYHEKNENVTWQDSDIRQWLNEDFLYEVFGNPEDQLVDRVCATKLKNKKNVRYGTYAGETTRDKIFLLSWEETFKEEYGFTRRCRTRSGGVTFSYGGVSDSRVCYPTCYAALKNPLITRDPEVRRNNKKNLSVEGLGSIYWILRTPGSKENYITYVSRWGRTTYNFDSPVDHLESCIRPALWMDLSGLDITKISTDTYCIKEDMPYTKAEQAKDYKKLIIHALGSETRVSAVKGSRSTKNGFLRNPVWGGNKRGEWEGDRVLFGRYRNEDILWRVLSTDHNRIILMSEYGIERMAYSTRKKVNTWEKSNARNWLNTSFYNIAFHEGEKSVILLNDTINKANPLYGTDNGGNTKDYVWLLSWEDCMREDYGFTRSEGRGPAESMTRVCYPTSYRPEFKRIFGKNDVNGNPIVICKEQAVSWWLREAGFDAYHTLNINRYGDALRHEQPECTSAYYVRPVIVLDANKIRLESKDGRYPKICPR